MKCLHGWMVMMTLAAPIVVSAAAAAHGDAGARAAARTAATEDERFPESDTERVQRSLKFTGTGPYRLEIDNVWGSIQVAAHDAETVELTLTKTLRARTPERLDAARKEVTLDVQEEPGLISLYVDGPFRDRDGDCDCGDSPRRTRNVNTGGNKNVDSATDRRSRWRGRFGRDWPDYVVEYDFVLRVPRHVELALRTVNRGDIRIEGTTGPFDVSNVNGGIEMLDIAGTGRVRTVNKDLRVVFRTNPAAPSSFSTVNGDVVVSFQPSLAANLRLKTFNGGLYSDFDTTTLPALTPVTERRDGKFVYRADRSVGVRVGAGGPELRFETLNGDIRILQRRK